MVTIDHEEANKGSIFSLFMDSDQSGFGLF